jgi:DNA-binding NtrC family response regulator
MPEISGLDLLMRIRDEFPGTRVIIMTAYGSEHVQKEVFRRGSIAYLEKTV